jgi:hypothetical protein
MVICGEPRRMLGRDDGDWALSEVCGLDWELVISGVEGRITMADIYDDVLPATT